MDKKKDEQSNADRFLNAYSAIEGEMKRMLKLGEHRRFFELVDRSARINPVIERFRFDLKEFSELRNAIVHDRAGGEIIAEPNNDAVASIENIAGLLLEPPKVAPLFLKEVFSLTINDLVSQAIRSLSRLSYTQAPILDEDKLVGLLTSHMIVKWMGLRLNDESLDIEHMVIKDILEQMGSESTYELVSVNKALFEIPDLFYQWQSKGNKLEAVLITQNGKSEEKLQGIITNRDLPRIHLELAPNNNEL